MKKIYSIEVPLYASPPKRLVEINRHENITVVVYAGFPNSPLNGGRNNFMLDFFPLYDRFFYGLTKRQLARAVAAWYRTITKLNQQNISCRLAFTNMFVSPEELNQENLSPVQWLVDSSQKYGVKNGIILNNPLLEKHLRQAYGDKLTYVSSCTKYVSPRKILSPQEALIMYREDSGRYDFVCLTPQDSRRRELLKQVVAGTNNNCMAICNSYCAYACNSYYHYEFTSKENKHSLLQIGRVDRQILAGAFDFVRHRIWKCSAPRQLFFPVNVENIARMQLNAGIVHFKLGRGFGDKCIDRLVACIRQFERGQG